jgi:hypothetical protein
MTTVQPLESKELVQKTDTQKKEDFIKHVVHNNALACHNIRNESFDMKRAKRLSEERIQALNAHDGLQAMIAAQMLAIHELQQKSMIFVNGLDITEHSARQYYTNSAIKLANTFIQQASLLAKLQGGVGQKITVERVEVNQGGQAIVGNVQGGHPTSEVKK